MTLPPDKIGDNGRRYVLQWFGYPTPGKWCDVGYSNRVIDIEGLTLPPSATGCRVIDRHASEQPE